MVEVVRKIGSLEITATLESLINECMSTVRDQGGLWLVKDLHPLAMAEGFWSVTIMRIGAD
jgi:tRNA1(Val) A37 N6-methylase TrmN6